jgi:hypothetical protein
VKGGVNVANKDQKKVVVKKPYQKPAIYPVGAFSKQTLGSKFEDTADMKNYYN